MKRRIYIFIFLVLISFILLVSSTYAWFSLNSSLETTGVSIRVSAVQKLEVSTDAKEWRQSITLHDILNADYDVPRYNQVPVKFQPVSTAGLLNNGKLDMFLGIVSSDKNKKSKSYGSLLLKAIKEVEEDGETGKFLAFDLYFKSDAEKPLFIGRNSYVTYEEESTGIENTLRLAFIKEGTLESDNISAIQDLKTNDTNNVKIWEPNFDSHTEYGISSAKSIYGLDIADLDGNQIRYYGIKKEIINPVPIDSMDNEYFSLMENNLYTDVSYNKKMGKNVLLFNLNRGITKVRVYAWIEGQDVDCENKAAGSSFIFNLHFTHDAQS